MKKNNKGFTLIELMVIGQFVLVVAMAVAWCVNIYKLTQCDFEPSYRGEVIHAIGLIPPAALVTVWSDTK